MLLIATPSLSVGLEGQLGWHAVRPSQGLLPLLRVSGFVTVAQGFRVDCHDLEFGA